MTEQTGPLVVGIGGTLRSDSSTGRALRHCLVAIERQGGRTRLFSGDDIALPMSDQLDLLASQVLTFARSHAVTI